MERSHFLPFALFDLLRGEGTPARTVTEAFVCAAYSQPNTTVLRERDGRPLSCSLAAPTSCVGPPGQPSSVAGAPSPDPLSSAPSPGSASPTVRYLGFWFGERGTGYAVAQVSVAAGLIVEVEEIGRFRVRLSRAILRRKTCAELWHAILLAGECEQLVARIDAEALCIERLATGSSLPTVLRYGAAVGIFAKHGARVVEVPQIAAPPETLEGRQSDRDFVAWALDLPGAFDQDWPSSPRMGPFGLRCSMGHVLLPGVEPAKALAVIQSGIHLLRMRERSRYRTGHDRRPIP